MMASETPERKALRDLVAVANTAWEDLHDWRRLAQEQRKNHPDPNHAANMPSQAGIDQTIALIERLGQTLAGAEAILSAPASPEPCEYCRKNLTGVCTIHRLSASPATAPEAYRCRMVDGYCAGCGRSADDVLHNGHGEECASPATETGAHNRKHEAVGVLVGMLIWNRREAPSNLVERFGSTISPGELAALDAIASLLSPDAPTGVR